MVKKIPKTTKWPYLKMSVLNNWYYTLLEKLNSFLSIHHDFSTQAVEGGGPKIFGSEILI